MKTVKFNTRSEFLKYIKGNSIEEIGRGREGIAFLTRDGRVIKYIESGLAKEYQLNDKTLLTTDVVWLESFYLPEVIYAIGNKIIGYETRYFSNNLFDKKGKINQTFIDHLLIARKNLLRDAKVLCDHHFFIYDAPPNILFNGKNLAFIDTLNYKYNPKVKLIENQMVLDHAICCALSKYDESFKYQYFEGLGLALKKNNYSNTIK